MAANGRNSFVIRGALKAAQKANAAIIIEIAKSEGGADVYCAIDFWQKVRIFYAICNELGITIPMAMNTNVYSFNFKYLPDKLFLFSNKFVLKKEYSVENLSLTFSDFLVQWTGGCRPIICIGWVKMRAPPYLRVILGF
jgi:hypothetical protein